jgi:hypothetical protein
MKSVPTRITALALLIASADAQTPAPPPKSTPSPQPPGATLKGVESAPAKRLPLKYTPPKNALAGTRIDGDGGSRGSGARQPSLYVLAPNHTGLTTRAQPSLFWYQSGPAAVRFELTIVEPKKARPLLRVGVDKADQPGIHRLPLKRYGVTLTPGVAYRWTVALVPDAANRSQDIISSGTIERVEPVALGGATGVNQAALLAGRGLWYDALETVTDELNATPQDKDLRRARAALLDEAGLHAAAAAERQ